MSFCPFADWSFIDLPSINGFISGNKNECENEKNEIETSGMSQKTQQILPHEDIQNTQEMEEDPLQTQEIIESPTSFAPLLIFDTLEKLEDEYTAEKNEMETVGNSDSNSSTLTVTKSVTLEKKKETESKPMKEKTRKKRGR